MSWQMSERLRFSGRRCDSSLGGTLDGGGTDFTVFFHLRRYKEGEKALVARVQLQTNSHSSFSDRVKRVDAECMLEFRNGEEETL